MFDGYNDLLRRHMREAQELLAPHLKDIPAYEAVLSKVGSALGAGREVELRSPAIEFDLVKPIRARWRLAFQDGRGRPDEVFA